LISIYHWEGQSLIFILMPMFLAAAVGFLQVWRRPRRTAFGSAATLAGMLFLGTSATVLSQIAFNMTRAPLGSEVIISIIFAVIPAILGVIVLRISRGEAGLAQRMVMAVIGTIALISGAGLLIGSALALAASALPSRRRSELESCESLSE
jgi:hypothetical protein